MSQNTTTDSARPDSTGRFAGDVLKLVSGTSFALAISTLATPVLTRMFAPEAFGLMTLFIAIASLIKIIACLRYELAIPLPSDSNHAAALVSACIGLSLLVSGVAALVIALAQESILRWLNTPDLQPYLKWIPVFIGVAGLQMSFSYWNSRKRYFGRISASNVFGGVVTTGGKLSTGFVGLTQGGSLILATVAGLVVSAATIGIHTFRDAGTLIKNNATPRKVWNQIKRYRKFPLFDAWGAVLNNASWQVPPLLFAAYFSPQVVGFYALAFRFIQLPMSLIGNSLGQAFYPRIADGQNQGEPMNDLVNGVFSRLVALGLLPSLLFALAGPELFSTIFGIRWIESGLYAQILSLWVFWWFIASPLSLVFTALEKQGLLLRYHILIFTTRLLSVLIGSLRQDVQLALWLFSITGMLVYGTLVVHVLSVSGVSFTQAIRPVWPYFKIALPLSMAVAIFKYIHHGSAGVTVAASLAVAGYALLAVHQDKELYRMLTSKLLKKG